MTTNEQTNPDQTGTWEPDWVALASESREVFVDWDDIETIWERSCQAVITEYRRQQAEQGMVEVRREDAAWAVMVIETRTANHNWGRLLADESYQRLLAAATEQNR